MFQASSVKASIILGEYRQKSITKFGYAIELLLLRLIRNNYRMKSNPSHSSKTISRRRFCTYISTSLAAVNLVPSYVLGLNGAESPNNKLNIAAIGVGGRGAADIDGLISQNIVALCDVDSERASAT